MNSVLEEIVRTGRTLLQSGEYAEITGFIDPECGALLQKIIHDLHPKVGVEIGLAFGISTLYILEAFRVAGGERLIGMDPAQFDSHWRGGGLYNVKRAGYEELYEFHEETSQQVLPRLAGENRRIDFAFIDGWHTFDHALVDFFYIDQMLNVGGVVVFDDVGYPSIGRLCDFIITNRDYSILDSVRLKREKSVNLSVRLQIKRIFAFLARTDKTPNAESIRKLSNRDDAYFLALRKRGDDNRRWDHFVHF